MATVSTLRNLIINHSVPAQLRAASNLLTSIYSLLIGLVFVPLYINYIGIEAYGIVGAFNGITGFLWLFDLGIATNINREMAGFKESSDKEGLLDLKKTLEIVCFGLSGTIFVFLMGFITFLAFYWFHSENFTPAFLWTILAILAFSLTLQFPIGFYTNALLGLNQQVSLNLISVFINTVKCIGAYASVIYFDDKIRAFLLIQAGFTLVQMLILMFVVRQVTTHDGYRAKFQLNLLRQIKQFTTELFANNLVTILLTQSDKVILSRMLTLEEFGYYMLAFTITTMTLNVFSNSVTNVVFPNFTRLATTHKNDELIANFHLSTRMMAWGAVSIGTMLVFFAREILYVWAGNQSVADRSATLLSLLAAAFTLNAILMVPYYLQHAFGRSNLSFRFNLMALFLCIPGFIVGVYYYGAVGAGICWLIMQLVYFVTFVPAIRRSFLQFNLRDWYVTDVGKILVTSVIIATVFHLFLPTGLSRMYLLLPLGFCFFCVAGFSFLVSKLYRVGFAADLLENLRLRFS